VEFPNLNKTIKVMDADRHRNQRQFIISLYTHHLDLTFSKKKTLLGANQLTFSFLMPMSYKYKSITLRNF